MTIWQRLKNLWKLSELKRDDKLDSPIISESKAQFFEPITLEEKFKKAKTVDDLLDS